MPEAENDNSSIQTGYALSRNYAAAARLNLQHYCFRDLLGYNIHPQIPVDPKDKNLSIADIGTGTGNWLTHVHRELPHARLDGFDSSLEQFPPKGWWPPNVTLEYLDALKPIPQELHGKYDIVHVRLFLFVIQNGDPRPLLDNAMHMLKPGGHLQWVEHDPETVHVEALHPEEKRSANEEIVRSVNLLRSCGWVSELPAHFENAGYISITHSTHSVPPELRMCFTHINLLAGEEVSYVANDNSGPESKGLKHRALLKEAFEETKKGVCMVWSPVVVLGKKNK
ncbi:MAG: hypothetical protein FRX48_07529 [Lasallia pustulata]|uniref:Methyltransferase domain-containing protein n=1 Tax=Lasallia pustulata TaxID=136370 RepID=A0A5M8PGG3_9LECA|nr:MAG: hypothetical protein FRX48_07529 [Lasallia pustulata]